jgi:hypothetical protein
VDPRSFILAPWLLRSRSKWIVAELATQIVPCPALRKSSSGSCEIAALWVGKIAPGAVGVVYPTPGMALGEVRVVPGTVVLDCGLG